MDCLSCIILIKPILLKFVWQNRHFSSRIEIQREREERESRVINADHTFARVEKFHEIWQIHEFVPYKHSSVGEKCI